MGDTHTEDRLAVLKAQYEALERKYHELAIRYVQEGGTLPVDVEEPPPERRSKSTAALYVIKGGLAVAVALLGWLIARVRQHHALTASLAGSSVAVASVVAWQLLAPVSHAPPIGAMLPPPPPTIIGQMPSHRPPRRQRRRPTAPPPRRGGRTKAFVRPGGRLTARPMPVPSGSATVPSTQPQPSPEPTPAPSPSPSPEPTRHGRHCDVKIVLGHKVKVCVNT